jgi:DNA-binding NarL/FixJ family response regulator
MPFRVVIAAGDTEFRRTLLEVTESARAMLPLHTAVEEAATVDEICDRLVTGPDALLLDWDSLPAASVAWLQRIIREYPELRVLLLLPGVGREYRETAWRLGACACVPRDRIDPEWLQAILCVMSRAKAREARIRARVA